MPNSCLIQDAEAGGWWRFKDAVEVLAVMDVGEVVAALKHAEKRVNDEGLWAAGYIAYEASPAFDPALETLSGNGLPLLWMGLFPKPALVQLPHTQPDEPVAEYRWRPSIAREQYDDAITGIRSLISAGDVYQVNYTLRLRADIAEDPQTLFLRMIRANDPHFAAYLDCEDFAVCSASPELFFRLDGEHLSCRPMKGTAARGVNNADDLAKARQLSDSAKDRAENVMIVDMVRNDLGRIAKAGTITAPRLFELERYPTLWQMTSSVEAQSRASVSEIMRALFPPASITGAPKIRATQIIADRESSARGVYTGCIGYIAPGRRARFNVAIRTAVVDRSHASVDYGVGGGIVWDSNSGAEYDECLLKARIVTHVTPRFDLLETLLWVPEEGYFLLEKHLQRLSDSAAYFGVRVELASVRQHLDALAAAFPAHARRVRLLVNSAGRVSCESCAMARSAGPLRLGVATHPIDRADPFLYNKTTHRRMYDDAKASKPGCDDVILWNASGEITETTIANLVLELDGEKFTPPVECGLLPGVFRAMLLEGGEIGERRMTLEDVGRASRIWTINAVRKWSDAKLIDVERGIEPKSPAASG